MCALGWAGGLFVLLVATLREGDPTGQQDRSSMDVAVCTAPHVGAATLHGASVALFAVVAAC